MSQRIFIRDIQAGAKLEIFIVSAISSLLLLRFYLYETGYPQVGGGNLHIAHMLYGGLFMLIAQILHMAFLGARLQRLAAGIGGIGFGVFIDEIGKFLTKDNNYFFRPAIGIIYATFVALYLVANFLARRRRLSSREYQLNALSQLEEAVLRDMDPIEKTRVADLLRRADNADPITQQLKTFLAQVNTVATNKPKLVDGVARRIDTMYQKVWRMRGSNNAVQIFFVLEIAIFIMGVLVTVVTNIDSIRDFLSGHTSYGHSLVVGQLVGTAVAAGFALYGIIKITSSRLDAFELFRRATLTNLLFTEFFIFSRIQFGAMPSFIFNLFLLLLIDFVIRQERRVTGKVI